MKKSTLLLSSLLMFSFSAHAMFSDNHSFEFPAQLDQKDCLQEIKKVDCKTVYNKEEKAAQTVCTSAFLIKHAEIDTVETFENHAGGEGFIYENGGDGMLSFMTGGLYSLAYKNVAADKSSKVALGILNGVIRNWKYEVSEQGIKECSDFKDLSKQVETSVIEVK